MGSINS